MTWSYAKHILKNGAPPPFGEHEKRVGVSRLLGAFGNNDFSEYFASYADASFLFSYPQRGMMVSAYGLGCQKNQSLA